MTTVSFIESCAGVSTIAQLAGAAANSTTTRWSCNDVPASYFAIEAGGDSGQRIKCISSSLKFLQLSVANMTTFVMGMKWTPVSVGAGQVAAMSASAGAGDNSMQIWRNGSELQLLANNTSRAITAGLGLAAGTRYAIELKGVFTSGSSWTVTVRVNGVVVIGPTSYVFTSSPRDSFTLGSSNVAGAANPANGDLYEGIYIADDFVAGGGSWQVQCIRPDGAGAHTDWVPDSGSNYARVNEQNVDDASYVQGTNDNDEDTYTYANPTHISGHAVRAVQVNSRAAYLAGAKKLAHVIRDGSGTEATGADKTLTGSLGQQTTVFNKQADGTTDWGSFNDLDSYQFGRKQKA